MTEAEKVAAGLSTKAKAAILAVSPLNHGFPYSQERWRLLPNLYRKGLVSQSMVPARLTPFGLTVRTILKGQDDEQ